MSTVKYIIANECDLKIGNLNNGHLMAILLCCNSCSGAARLRTLRKFDPVDDETDEDENNNNNESSKGPSNADAFSALETAMEWYEQQSECCPTQLLLLKRVRDLWSEKTNGYNGAAKNK
ncbi:hypothetical protein TNCV_4354001 [Trichonephila clavipes]|nr:hypothetical protein TNCV_4354001 [Trichonephila clavipes]